MGKLVLEANFEFQTKGIWMQKGSKKVTLEGKEAADRFKKTEDLEPKLHLIHIDPEDGFSRMSFPIGNENLISGSMNIVYDKETSGFAVKTAANFELSLADSLIQQFKEEGKKLLFRIQGVEVGGGPAFGGYLSFHKDFVRQEDNYGVCPKVAATVEQ